MNFSFARMELNFSIDLRPMDMYKKQKTLTIIKRNMKCIMNYKFEAYYNDNVESIDEIYQVNM